MFTSIKFQAIKYKLPFLGLGFDCRDAAVFVGLPLLSANGTFSYKTKAAHISKTYIWFNMK